MPRIRRPWTTGISLVAAAAVALALLLVPFGPKQESPLNPRAVLARALAATTHITPYRATVEASTGVPFSPPLDARTKDLATSRIVYQFAVRDATHWRMNMHVLTPPLYSGHAVAVANGRKVTWYEGLTDRAAWHPLPTSRIGALFLRRFEGDAAGPFGQMRPLDQSLQQWIRKLDNPQTGTHARMLGQQTVIGRTADVVEVWPAGRVYPSDACKPAHPSRVCLRESTAVGRARFWIDHEHGVVLRYQVVGEPGAPALPYQVTAITFGAEPSAAELGFRPPVRPVKTTTTNPWQLVPLPGSGNAPWAPGFIAAQPPFRTAGVPYILRAIFTSQGVLGAGPQLVIFQTPNDPSPPGSFLFIQEQPRVALPTALMAGRRWRAGACIAYTGTYPDKLHWLAVARGHVSLLAVADALGERDLVHWAAARVCPRR
jgi:hypothetical protein